MTKPTILIIEDEDSILDILSYNLRNHGYEVQTASDGQAGLEEARASLPDLIILDVMIPVIDGLEVCRQLRSDPRTQQIRILMLTAKGEEADEVLGFNLGADDYVTKPFRVKPLIERIRAQLRRPAASRGPSDVVAIGGIEINRVNHTASVNGGEMPLTPTEFHLLWTFTRHPSRTFSRYELMDLSRGADANSLERTIDVHIRSLRKKLGEHAELIETVRGVGYRFRSGTAKTTRSEDAQNPDHRPQERSSAST